MTTTTETVQYTRHVKLDKDIDENCTHKFSIEYTVYRSAITNMVMAESVKVV